MSAGDFEEEGRVKRRVIAGAVVVLLLGGMAAFVLNTSKEPPKKRPKPVEIVAITPLPPPPPPPPPPPEPEQPPEPEESEELTEPEDIAEAEPDEPGPEEPPEGLGTGLTGDGPNSFGLTSRGDGARSGRGGGGGGTASARAAFESGLRGTLESEIRRHPALKQAVFNVTLRVRVSAEGRILSVRVQPSSGNPAIDQAFASGFAGVLRPQPPPGGKPVTLDIRTQGRKARP